MTTHIRNVSTINQADVRAQAIVSERGPTPLTKAELDHVAAAGSKPGASGGSGCTVDRPRPPRPN